MKQKKVARRILVSYGHPGERALMSVEGGQRVEEDILAGWGPETSSPPRCESTPSLSNGGIRLHFDGILQLAPTHKFACSPCVTFCPPFLRPSSRTIFTQIPTKDWFCSPCLAGLHPSTLVRFCWHGFVGATGVFAQRRYAASSLVIVRLCFCFG